MCIFSSKLQEIYKEHDLITLKKCYRKKPIFDTKIFVLTLTFFDFKHWNLAHRCIFTSKLQEIYNEHDLIALKKCYGKKLI